MSYDHGLTCVIGKILSRTVSRGSQAMTDWQGSGRRNNHVMTKTTRTWLRTERNSAQPPGCPRAETMKCSQTARHPSVEELVRTNVTESSSRPLTSRGDGLETIATPADKRPRSSYPRPVSLFLWSRLDLKTITRNKQIITRPLS